MSRFEEILMTVGLVLIFCALLIGIVLLMILILKCANVI